MTCFCLCRVGRGYASLDFKGDCLCVALVSSASSSCGVPVASYKLPLWFCSSLAPPADSYLNFWDHFDSCFVCARVYVWKRANVCDCQLMCHFSNLLSYFTFIFTTTCCLYLYFALSLYFYLSLSLSVCLSLSVSISLSLFLSLCVCVWLVYRLAGCLSISNCV